MLTLTLPDQSVKQFPVGTTALEVAMSIGAGLAKASLAAKLDGQWLDLRTPIANSGKFEIITEKLDDLKQQLIKIILQLK